MKIPEQPLSPPCEKKIPAQSKGEWRMQIRASDAAGNATTWTLTIKRV